MKTDIEIAQEAQMFPIAEIARNLGLKRMSWSSMVAIRPSYP